MKKTILSTLTILATIFSFSQTNKLQAIDTTFIRFSNTRDFTISKNTKEAYFTVQSLDEKSSIIVRSEFKNGHWNSFKMVRFSGKHRDIEPFLTPNNLRLYFSSNRPKGNSITKTSDYDIWYVERKSIDDNWSKPINIGFPINTSFNEFYPSLSTNNNIYYTSDSLAKTNKDDLFFSEWNNGKYKVSNRLDSNINSTNYEFNAYISPNEDFLIYTVYRAKDGFGSGDLYISFKNAAGKFEYRKNMGTSINSSKMDYCPFYDDKNNILYFTSKRNDVKFNDVNGLNEFEHLINQYNNGSSRIYKIAIDLSSTKNN